MEKILAMRYSPILHQGRLISRECLTVKTVFIINSTSEINMKMKFYNPWMKKGSVRFAGKFMKFICILKGIFSKQD
ncbi:hypothetical protein BMF90_24400 [Serratia sp. OLHL2]|nr:hypothetical protein BMF87_24415 [Serratia sp. OLEL1]PII56223.1 hypothetical protein BMF85_15815 [Serratia sp. OLCL1]PII57698.1 hypothetical protein BMF90_24400 [Serratia sp. OLHL2]PII73469.1 hypothetical protein BMH23_13600 [Serratia sp. OLIL2]PII80309.1 hypothetical protein BMH24_11045 [Serratia sp. OLJL1]PII96315.1 hypothetical protein BMF91_01115 [Serratia sp. OLFL2]PIJ18185.1 hypothetical protein BVV03_20345 [Serratia sp. OSPLW9]PIJ29841.1 hypothetical protein BOM26_25075 [Serratia s